MGQAITDDELVAASRRGERAAFGQLVERHLDAVWAVSYSSTRNPTLSEDVAQDTFVAAWRQLDALREPGRLRAWLCGIARNLARTARRRQRRETPVDQVDDRASLAATPYEALSQAETDRLVATALDELPASYREVLVLYYQHDRSIRDVASALGISAEAATQRLSRGRRLLATHVVGTVEDALTRRRPPRAFVVGLLAVLPPRPPSSLIAGSLRSTSQPAGATMLKIAALVLATAGAAGTAYVATRPSATPLTASASPTAAAATTPALGAAPSLRSPTAIPPTPVVPRAIAAPTPAGGSCEPGQPGGACEPGQVIADGDRVDPALAAQVGLDRGPSKGPADAPVTIVVYQDLECPYCAKVVGTVDALWDEYPGQLRLVVKDFPLDGHPHARLAAEAARIADAQGKLWEFRDLCLAFQDDLSRAALIGLAGQAGLDVGGFTRDLDGHRYATDVAADFDGGMTLGVRGTPAFFINGRRFTGAQPIESFRTAIERALADRS